jgi:hypothetical protein
MSKYCQGNRAALQKGADVNLSLPHGNYGSALTAAMEINCNVEVVELRRALGPSPWRCWCHTRILRLLQGHCHSFHAVAHLLLQRASGILSSSRSCSKQGLMSTCHSKMEITAAYNLIKRITGSSSEFQYIKRQSNCCPAFFKEFYHLEWARLSPKAPSSRSSGHSSVDEKETKLSKGENLQTSGITATTTSIIAQPRSHA